MDDYVESMIIQFRIKIIRIDKSLTVSRNNLFENFNRKSLGKKETEDFHTSVARGIFVNKIVRPDIHQTFVMSSMRV